MIIDICFFHVMANQLISVHQPNQISNQIPDETVRSESLKYNHLIDIVLNIALLGHRVGIAFPEAYVRTITIISSPTTKGVDSSFVSSHTRFQPTNYPTIIS